jgi:hypothetical protein
LAQTKKIISKTFKIRVTLVFLCSKEREGERGGERERESEKGKGKEKKKEREKEEKARAILFPNRLVQSEKSANYTVLYRKEREIIWQKYKICTLLTLF